MQISSSSSISSGDLIYLTDASGTAMGERSSNQKRKKWEDLDGGILPPVIGGLGRTAYKLVLLSENVGTNHVIGTKLEWR